MTSRAGRRLKVLYLHDNLRMIGGAEVAFYDEVEAARSRFDVALHVFDDGADRPPPADTLVTPYRLRGGAAAHLPYHYFSPSNYRRLRRYIEAERPDVIHLHKHNKLTLTQLAATRGFPVVHTVHDFGLVCPTGWLVTARSRQACVGGAGLHCVTEGCVSAGRFLAAFTVPWALKAWVRRRRVSAFITPSRALADTLEAHGYPRPHVVPYIQAVVTPRPPRAPGPPRILYLGHLIPAKGVDVLLDAFLRIAADFPSATLEFVGDGALRDELAAKAEASGLGGRVALLGRLPHAEAVARLDAATIAVVPSVWTENSALTAHEALSRGRALVASRIGGLPELCRERETGLLATPGDPADLARALAELLRDPALVERLGDGGYRLAAAEFSAERHLERLEAVYREVLA